MMTMSHSATAAEAHAAPKAKSRNFSIDRARTFLTLVVLLHHAVIPYTYFGHTDPTSWIGFDVVVLATDSFFMAMFFFLSGLFIWPGIARKAPQVFLRDRLLRLGLPFVIAAFTIIPLAYYAIALRQNHRADLRGVLVEDDHRRPVAERPDLVRVGAAGVRPDRKPALPRLRASGRPGQPGFTSRI